VIHAWRLCRLRFASRPLDGEGARRAGGRWGSRGTPMVYCASSLSLGALECLVHFDLSEAPADYVAIPITIPDDVVERLDVTGLPMRWRDTPPLTALARIGDRWVREQRSAVLQVPSAIVPVEPNFLIHPGHPDAARIETGAPRPFQFDPRLFVADSSDYPLNPPPNGRARRARRR
jgi:RES domain-containing protein